MDLELLEFKAECANLVRNFFWNEGYLEVDTPCFSEYIIPESSIEIFQTIKTPTQSKQYFLVPSPEVHIKKLLAQHKRSMFSLSHCFRAGENKGKIHNPEFIMLEYYTVNANYLDSIKITEKFFKFLITKLQDNHIFDKKTCIPFTKNFLLLSVDEAFEKYAGFKLSENRTQESLLSKVNDLRLNCTGDLSTYSTQDLYELILVALIEPNLPKNQIVALIDYPTMSKTLSKNKIVNNFEVTERWEIYLNGIELANCYSELTDEDRAKLFIQSEIKKRDKKNMTKIIPPPEFEKICSNLPKCSGVALGFERLLMLLSGKKSIEMFS